MNGNADSTLVELKKQRDFYRDGLSERARTLCLGSVALIWGILTKGKANDSVIVTRTFQFALLGIGLALIIVLMLDFGEYFCAFGYRRQLAGDDEVSQTRNYEKWESNMRSIKIGLGAVALLALCLALAGILVTPLFAQIATLAYPYTGKWCGGNPGLMEYTCVQISKEGSETIVHLSYQGREDPILCSSVILKAPTVEATCGREFLVVSPSQASRRLPLAVKLELKERAWTHELRRLNP